MKTKIIPFDAKMAKDIQDGKIKGKIVYCLGNDYKPARIICWDRIPSYPIVALVKIGPCYESVFFFSLKGDSSSGGNSLILEVPDKEPQFKPFDKVLVRKPYLIDPHDIYEPDKWVPTLFQGVSDDGCYFIAEHKEWEECIPYEGNEHLVGTTNKPKEE